MSKIILGTEILRCPRCRSPKTIDVHSDIPDQDYLVCDACGYRALVKLVPILDKYGLPYGLTRTEKRSFAHHLKKNIALLN